jgi:hypothetical protein
MRATLLFSALLALTAAGCGAKTAIDERHDGGPPRDAFALDTNTDAFVPMGLVVDCGRPDQYTAPNRPITVSATATSDSGVTSQGWTLASQPTGAMAGFTDMGASAQVVPNLEGDYALRFDARDGAGHTASCTVTVHAVTGPPVAICPSMMAFRTRASTNVRLNGDSFSDVGIASATWTVTSAPAGAMPVITPVMGAIADFQSATPGDYTLTLTVVDIRMRTGSCAVTVHVIPPLVVTCPGPLSGLTRRALTVMASATAEGTLTSLTWTLDTQPAGSTAMISPTSGLTTMITPDKVGPYNLSFVAMDSDGQVGRCTVLVNGLHSPPEAICPDHVDVAPLSTATVTAMAIDDGTITNVRWRLVSRPPGSASADPSPLDNLTTMVPTDLAGDYPMELTVTDDHGDTATCMTLVRAVNSSGLRVEMFWDTDRTDMDTHLMRPEGTTWGDTDDCNFRNCRGGLAWGAPGSLDDPSLDIDDTDGFGPENINIMQPYPGVYRVAIHAWNGQADVTVRIYCGGSTTMPRQTFGPVSINSSSNDFWRVADVTIDATGCSIADLAAGGRPNIQPLPGGSGPPR